MYNKELETNAEAKDAHNRALRKNAADRLAVVAAKKKLKKASKR